MTRTTFDRREFHWLSAAALSGLGAGLSGCSQRGNQANPGDAAVAKADVHLCRGLNECKGLGKGGNNDCRGQGHCATSKEHSCGGQNECKGLGGCGDTAGVNECKGQGGCHVPLMTDAWKKLRQQKESEWAEKKLDFSPPPATAADAGQPT